MLYLVEITEVLSGTTSKAIWDKNDIDEALMSLHQIMASAIANSNTKSCLCKVMDSRGAEFKHEYWERRETEEE